MSISYISLFRKYFAAIFSRGTDLYHRLQIIKFSKLTLDAEKS